MAKYFRIALRAETTTPEADAISGLDAWSYDQDGPSFLEIVTPSEVIGLMDRAARRRIEESWRKRPAGALPGSRVTVISREDYLARQEVANAACGD